MFESSLSALLGEKILIQLDTLSHDFSYNADTKTINKFDVFTQIKVTPPDILLSQKIYAIFNRKRSMGRDFYDVVFLLWFTKPNYEYLQMKMGIGGAADLRNALLKKIQHLDFAELHQDVKALLIASQDGRKIELFPEYIREGDLGG